MSEDWLLIGNNLLLFGIWIQLLVIHRQLKEMRGEQSKNT